MPPSPPQQKNILHTKKTQPKQPLVQTSTLQQPLEMKTAYNALYQAVDGEVRMTLTHTGEEL